MPRRRVALSVLIAALVWGLDRSTKVWATRHLVENHTTDIWGSWLGWTLHWNTGAAFGLASHSPVPLQIFATALTLVLTVWWLHTLRKPAGRIASFESAALALILAGSAGNLTDRFLFGAVIDFIDFKVWPIFNCADIAISVGAAVWALCVIFGRRNQKENA